MFTPWKESYNQFRQHIKKQRHYFINKYLASQSYGFSSSHVWMWELDSKESWAPKNWCFWTVLLRRLLRVHWTARRSNHSILYKISPEYSLEVLMLELKLQYFGHPMRRTDHWKRPWFWARLKTVGEGDNREWDGWMTSLKWWMLVWVGSGSWWLIGKPGVLQSMRSQKVGHDWVTKLNWTELSFDFQLLLFLIWIFNFKQTAYS